MVTTEKDEEYVRGLDSCLVRYKKEKKMQNYM
jgi:hypothetical protein